MSTMGDIESAIGLVERVKKMWENRKAKKLDTIIEKVDNMDSTIKADISNLDIKLDKEIKAVYNKIDENDIKLKRDRILVFADEIRRKISHSQESYVQIMDDITKYNKYCTEHPKFENERTVIASKVIKDSYNSKLNPEKEQDQFLV